MDFFEKIRGFFGMPPRYGGHNGPGFQNHGMGDDDDDDDDNDDFPADEYMFHNWGGPSGFNIFSGNIQDMERFLEQQLEEMMKHFQSTWSWSTFPQIEAPERFGEVGPGNSAEFDDNPRRKFLKPEYLEPGEVNPNKQFLQPAYIQPPVNPSEKKDTDIDSNVDPSKILDIFPDKNADTKAIQPYSRKSHYQSHFSSQVIKKRILPNGGIEEEKRATSDGKEEVTVSRQLGDVKHIVTTIKLPDGTVEKHEQFINMDQDKLSDFNKSWDSASSSSSNFQKPKGNSEIFIPERHSLFEIFSKFIP